MSPRTNTRRPQKSTHQRPNLRQFGRMMFVTGIAIAISAAGTWGVLALNSALSVTKFHVDAPISLRTAINSQLKDQPMDFYHTFPPLLRRHLLAAIPALADIQISRHVSGVLDIKAIARQPIANWTNAKGNMLLVDRNGTAYPGVAGMQPILPMLRIPAAQLPKAAALLAHLRQLSQSRFANLSEVDAIDGAWKLYFDRGESWEIPRHGAIRRVNRLYALMEQPRWNKDAWRVDARMDYRWFIRPAQSKEVI